MQKVKLDSIDRKLLELLQADAEIQVADLAAQVWDFTVGDVPQIAAESEDLAGGGPLLAQNKAEERRFPGPGGAHKEHKLAALDLHADIVKRGSGASFYKKSDFAQ